MDLPANVMQHARSGRLLVLGATAPSGLASVKDVPLISAEHPAAMVSGWSGFFAPAGTPAEVIARFEQAVRDAIADSAVLGMLANVGMSPSTMPRAEFIRTVEADHKRFGAIISASDIELQ